MICERGARFALVGGLAVSARCEPRFTRDLDLAVAVSSDREAEALVGALMNVGYRVVAQIEQETTRRLATVRLSPPDGALLFRFTLGETGAVTGFSITMPGARGLRFDKATR